MILVIKSGETRDDSSYGGNAYSNSPIAGGMCPWDSDKCALSAPCFLFYFPLGCSSSCSKTMLVFNFPY